MGSVKGLSVMHDASSWCCFLLSLRSSILALLAALLSSSAPCAYLLLFSTCSGPCPALLRSLRVWRREEGIKAYKAAKNAPPTTGVVEKPHYVTNYYKKREEIIGEELCRCCQENMISTMELQNQKHMLNEAWDRQVQLEQKFDIITHQPKKGHIHEVKFVPRTKPPSLNNPPLSGGCKSHRLQHHLHTQVCGPPLGTKELVDPCKTYAAQAPPALRPPRLPSPPRKQPFLTNVNKPREFDIISNTYKEHHGERMQFEAERERQDVMKRFWRGCVGQYPIFIPLMIHRREFDAIKVRYTDEEREEAFQSTMKENLLRRFKVLTLFPLMSFTFEVIRGKDWIKKLPPTYQVSPAPVS
eukprot:763710-Hanusia_phi.AAC.5